MIGELIKKHGTSTLAKKLDESEQAVNNWVSRGVPLAKTIAFCRAVDYEVTPHMLHPENYPNPNDGLPASLCSSEGQAV